MELTALNLDYTKGHTPMWESFPFTKERADELLEMVRDILTKDDNDAVLCDCCMEKGKRNIDMVKAIGYMYAHVFTLEEWTYVMYVFGRACEVQDNPATMITGVLGELFRRGQGSDEE